LENPFEVINDRLIRIESLIIRNCNKPGKKKRKQTHSVASLAIWVSEISVRKLDKKACKIQAKRIGGRILTDQPNLKKDFKK
jgi:hypothetical protein